LTILKTVRIIAYNQALQRANHMRVVNVWTTPPARLEYPQVLQAAAGPVAGEYPTWMASGAANTPTNGLPNVYIAGYSGPS
jgi:hypothetical protein